MRLYPFAPSVPRPPVCRRVIRAAATAGVALTAAVVGLGVATMHAGAEQRLPAANPPVHSTVVTPPSNCKGYTIDAYIQATSFPHTIGSFTYRAPVEWFNDTSTDVEIQDTTGMNLFDQTIPGNSDWTYTYVAAGTYTFDDAADPALSGRVVVPFCGWALETIPPHGSHRLFFAPGPAVGYAFDVEIRKPGTARWTWWRYDNRTGQTVFSSTRIGYYSFRSRLRQLATNKTSGFSPIEVVQVR